MADRTARRAARGRARDFLRHRIIPPMGVRISAAIASLIPAGTHSTDHIAGLVRDLLDTGAIPHRGLRISTVDRLSARRVVFGPDPEWLPQAVAASCAVPGWFVPVEIDGAYYVDGGVHSNFSLDVAADAYSARVAVLSPLSGVVSASRDPGWLAMGVARAEIGRMLRRELRRAARLKAHVVVMEPGTEEVLAMGLNLMDDTRGPEIHALALERTRATLREPAWQAWMGDVAG
jgi:NTE family protein